MLLAHEKTIFFKNSAFVRVQDVVNAYKGSKHQNKMRLNAHFRFYIIKYYIFYKMQNTQVDVCFKWKDRNFHIEAAVVLLRLFLRQHLQISKNQNGMRFKSTFQDSQYQISSINCRSSKLVLTLNEKLHFFNRRCCCVIT